MSDITTENNLETDTETTTLGTHSTETTTETGTNGEQANVAASHIQADQYSIKIEGFDFDAFKSEASNQSFLENLAAKGVSNDALETIVGEYAQHLGKLEDTVFDLIEAHSAKTTESLEAEWGEAFNKNLAFARTALLGAGFTQEQFNDPRIGNNQALIQLAAYFGEQMQEDAAPENTQQSSSQSVEQLMQSEAYLNDKHPAHSAVYAKVLNGYSKQYKDV